MGEYAEYGFDQQGWYGMFVACGIWCFADVSSVSPSSEQTAQINSALSEVLYVSLLFPGSNLKVFQTIFRPSFLPHPK